DADLRGMVVLRSLGFQLVPFKLHRFRKQRLSKALMASIFFPLTLKNLYVGLRYACANLQKPRYRP
ncbi:hypothetical protein ACW5WG_21210, partial [Aeromonas salmonicida]